MESLVRFLEINQSKPFDFHLILSNQKVAELVAKKYNAEIEIIPMPAKLQGQYQTYTSADLTELNKNIEHKFKTVEEFLNAN